MTTRSSAEAARMLMWSPRYECVVRDAGGDVIWRAKSTKEEDALEAYPSHYGIFGGAGFDRFRDRVIREVGIGEDPEATYRFVDRVHRETLEGTWGFLLMFENC